MANSVFRQKSIDKINSPESLNDYLRVTNPSVWIVLIGTVIFITGALIFSAFGRVDTNIKLAVEAADGQVTAYVDEADIDSITEQSVININGTDYSVNSIAKTPLKYSDVDEYVLHKGNMEASQWLFPVKIEGSIPDGAYLGTITVEQISPISYIFN